MRAVLDGSRTFALASGAALTPSLEIGVRHDAGDAETGTGMELGAGLGYADPSRGLDMALRAHGLAAHAEEGYGEWGISGTLRLVPDASGRGLSMSLTPSWGADPGGSERLWMLEDAHALAANDNAPPSSRFDADLSYGIALFGGGVTGTPNAGFGMSDAAREYRLGWRMNTARRIRRGLRGQPRPHPARGRRRGGARDRAARHDALVGGGGAGPVPGRGGDPWFRAFDDPAPVFRHGVRWGRATSGSGCQARADTLASRERCRAPASHSGGRTGPGLPVRPLSRNRLTHENPYRRPWSGMRRNRRRRPDTRGIQARNRCTSCRREADTERAGSDQPERKTEIDQKDLVRRVAAATGLGTARAKAAVEAVLEAVTGAIARDEAVRLPRFGIFSRKQRRSHTVRIPSTGAFVTRPASQVVQFRPGKILREAAKAGEAAGRGEPDTDDR